MTVARAPLRLLHTSDWHLGHTLRDFTRENEHARFLEWLLDTLVSERIDALLVAGDVFETSSPPATALQQWYGFLSACRRRLPELDVVVIGGNHDSAARLDAPNALLEGSRLRVIGGLPGRAPHDMVVRIGPPGSRGWVCAVPFLRTSDLPQADLTEHDPLVAGVRAVYDEVFGIARQLRGLDEPLVAMGHLYMVGGEVSELSERKVLGGNQHALPSAIFPDDVVYAALGHLHKAQIVEGRSNVRYSGSPLPLSATEADYEHQVLRVELAADGTTSVTPLRVPRAVPIVRVPSAGAAPLLEVEAALARLPDRDAVSQDEWPFVVIHVAVDKPEPTLQARIHDALAERAARLVRIEPVRIASGGSLASSEPQSTLADLTPERVFVRLHEREHGRPPTVDLLAAFHEILEAVAREPTG